MTTMTAAQRRAILAYAYTLWRASENSVAARNTLAQALKQTDMIAITDTVTEVWLDGTTISIFIDCDEFEEVIELDAYGNTLKGTV